MRILTAEELQAKLKSISKDMLPAIKKGMTDAVQNVEGKAKENCTPGTSPYYRAPRITGTLVRSINSKLEVKGSEVRGIVGADTDYAQKVHDGTSKMPPRPYILDAIKEEEDTTVEILSSAIESKLREHTV